MLESRRHDHIDVQFFTSAGDSGTHIGRIVKYPSAF
jgi:hypothetical protein